MAQDTAAGFFRGGFLFDCGFFHWLLDGPGSAGPIQPGFGERAGALPDSGGAGGGFPFVVFEGPAGEEEVRGFSFLNHGWTRINTDLFLQEETERTEEKNQTSTSKLQRSSKL
jgi:hypothetical protein